MTAGTHGMFCQAGKILIADGIDSPSMAMELDKPTDLVQCGSLQVFVWTCLVHSAVSC